MIYLACPYTDPDPLVTAYRMEMFAKVAGGLILEGGTVVSPLYNHFIVPYAPKLKTDWASWEQYSREMMSKCSIVFVMNLPGWETSQGVRGEIEMAKEFGIPWVEFDVAEFLSGDS